MTGFLAELGKKLAERWLTLLVLPGALFLGTLTTALILRWAHAFDGGLLVSRLDAWFVFHSGKSFALVLFLLAILLGSAAAGLAAQALGTLIAQLWLAENWEDWPPPIRALAGHYRERRRRRWEQARAAYESARAEAGLARAQARIGIAAEKPADLTSQYRRLLRISTMKPNRPTWIGDRVHAASTMLWANYNIDLPTVWPALLLAAPQTMYNRIEVEAESYQQAATLAAWSILYLIPAVIWGPALVIPLVAWITAYRRARASVDSYNSLVEACVIMTIPEVARTLGIENSCPLTRQTGNAITRRLQGRNY